MRMPVFRFPDRWREWIVKTMLFVILFIPCVFAYMYASSLQEGLFVKVAYIVIYAIILVIPLSFLKNRAYFLLEGITVLLMPVEMAHLKLYGVSVSSGFMTAVMQTDFHEASEVFVSFKYEAIAILAMWLLYFFLVSRVRNEYMLSRKVRLAVVPLFLLANCFLFVYVYSLSVSEGGIRFRLADAYEKTVSKYRKVYPINMFMAFAEYRERMKEVDAMQHELADFSFGASSVSPEDEKEVYVLIIGESARSANFSINGYSRETNPRLSVIPNLVSFRKAYSVSCFTEVTLPLMLSRATPENPDIAYKEKTIPELFGECGFYTAWIADQSFKNPYIVRIAEDLDYSHITSTEYDARKNYDEYLLPALDEVLASGRRKTFVVMHTLGSHFRYNYRYPDSFAKFKPGIPDNFSYGDIAEDKRDMFVNSYDNTILYTDYIISEVIRRVKEQHCTASVVYMSDHGENLYDDASGRFLHGSENPTEYEIHVPMIVWMSDEYIAEHGDKYEAMKRNTDKTVSTTNLFHTIADLGMTTYPSEQKQYSIASDSFVESNSLSILRPDGTVISNDYVK